MRSPARRHWRSYGDDPLPTGREALDEQFSGLLSWVHAGHLRPVRRGASNSTNAARSGRSSPPR